jgi:hypothetical protein
MVHPMGKVQIPHVDTENETPSGIQTGTPMTEISYVGYQKQGHATWTSLA